MGPRPGCSSVSLRAPRVLGPPGSVQASGSLPGGPPASNLQFQPHKLLPAAGGRFLKYLPISTLSERNVRAAVMSKGPKGRGPGQTRPVTHGPRQRQISRGSKTPSWRPGSVDGPGDLCRWLCGPGPELLRTMNSQPPLPK